MTIPSDLGMIYTTHSSKAGFWGMIGLAGMVGLVAIQLAAGCSQSNSGPNAFRGVERAEQYAEGTSGRRITSVNASAPLSINGEAVSWDTILPRLGEAAGGLVVEEVALERLLASELTRRDMSISAEDLDREHQWLLTTIAGTRQVNETEVYQLISEIRRRRGLGPERYASLLRRNAMLRALVRDRVEVQPEQVELAWRVQHGERVQTRIIVTPTQREAQQLRVQALAGDAAGIEVRFAKLAQTHSTDNSAPRGGLIEPFSTEDPAYEETIRKAAALLEPGQVGPIVAIRNGFALVYLDARLPGDGVTLDETRTTLTEQLRQRQERLLMDALATQLLAEARVNVIDPSLSWSVRAGEGR